MKIWHTGRKARNLNFIESTKFHLSFVANSKFTDKHITEIGYRGIAGPCRDSLPPQEVLPAHLLVMTQTCPPHSSSGVRPGS